jgi:tRNA-dihydrouridine synthase A
VQEGRFGACLMAEPDLVAQCVMAMARAVSVPVTVKCRIGIDDQDTEAGFQYFVDRIADAGCRTVIVHARKAWLKGLSPKENREIPPLDYGRVYRLKAARPDLTVILNGGIDNLDACAGHLQHVDGVMLGRAAYHDPYILAEVDRRFFGASEPPVSRRAALERLIPAIERQIASGGRLNNITRHVLGIYHGRPRGRLFRRILSEEGQRPGAGVEVLLEAIAAVEGDAPLASARAAE